MSVSTIKKVAVKMEMSRAQWKLLLHLAACADAGHTATTMRIGVTKSEFEAAQRNVVDNLTVLASATHVEITEK